MKYIIVIGDGMADFACEALNGRTPLEAARKPNIDRLAERGEVGTIVTVPEGMEPGSDVANLSVLGYDPKKCYSGRAPLEALSIGAEMGENDACLRANLVTLSDADRFEDRVMVDYCSGEIPTPDGRELIRAIDSKFNDGIISFYGGVSYRHCALLRDNKGLRVEFTPPHDITGKRIGDYLPRGAGADVFVDLMRRSAETLKNHPINVARREAGLHSADAIWFWGKGTKPCLENFREKYGLTGAVISATDLMKGIGRGTGMDVIEVEGATGTLKTNFLGKAEACLKSLEDRDCAYLHFEAPDECGHQGDARGKALAIEKIDEAVGRLTRELDERRVDYCIAVLPDHYTPTCLRKHLGRPVPFLVYNSARPKNCGLKYTEKQAENGIYLSRGESLMQYMLKS